jgi:hypothetical protein
MVSMALPRWGLAPETAVSVLNLSENATFALADPHTGRELVLRVHRVGYSSAEEIRSELAWIEALGHEGVVDTATPVIGVDGQRLQTLTSSAGAPSRHAVAFARLPGSAPDPATDAIRWFDRLGELTARMHRSCARLATAAGLSTQAMGSGCNGGSERLLGSVAGGDRIDPRRQRRDRLCAGDASAHGWRITARERSASVSCMRTCISPICWCTIISCGSSTSTTAASAGSCTTLQPP